MTQLEAFQIFFVKIVDRNWSNKQQTFQRIPRHDKKGWKCDRPVITILYFETEKNDPLLFFISSPRPV